MQYIRYLRDPINMNFTIIVLLFLIFVNILRCLIYTLNLMLGMYV